MKNIHTKLSAILFLLIFSSFTLSACSVTYNESGTAGSLGTLHEKTFQISEGNSLLLHTSTGDVMITPWDRSEVYVKVLGNEKAREKMTFEFDAGSSEVEITGKHEKSFLNWGSSGIKVRFEIKVPARFNIKAATSGGDFRVGGISGDINLKTSGGDINLKETEGELSASTSGGDIKVEKTSGRTSVSTSGGDIVVVDFNGSLKANTSGGDIDLRGGNGEIKAVTSGGDIMLDYSGSSSGIELATSGGDIDILVPADFKASVKLATSGGSVDSNFDLKRDKSKRKIEGDLNGGGNVLTAKTSGGDVNLRKK